MYNSTSQTYKNSDSMSILCTFSMTLSNKIQLNDESINTISQILQRMQAPLSCFPTGMGKTIIALLVIAKELAKKNKHPVSLTNKTSREPTCTDTNDLLTLADSVAVFTGEVPPEKRIELWNSKRIIVSTPQVIENDLIARRYDLSNISRIIFDEAHRAAGNYSYVFIAEMFKKQQKERRCLGMTASPGNNLSEILEVCKNLEITNIEIRTKIDPDVQTLRT